jgi:hypothetical protein
VSAGAGFGDRLILHAAAARDADGADHDALGSTMPLESIRGIPPAKYNPVVVRSVNAEELITGLAVLGEFLEARDVNALLIERSIEPIQRCPCECGR